MLIVHRGLVNNYDKENSLEAFKNAFRDTRYAGIELDIRTSLDKKLVVVHDFFIHGHFIKKTSSEELHSLGIPCLEEVLKLDTDKMFLIEIKEEDIDIDNLLSILEKYSDRNIYVMSFHNKVIKEIATLKPSFKCGILNYVFNSEYSYNEYDFVGLMNSTLTSDLVEYFKRKKIELFSYGLIGPVNNYFDDVYYIVDPEDI